MYGALFQICLCLKLAIFQISDTNTTVFETTCIEPETAKKKWYRMPYQRGRNMHDSVGQAVTMGFS